MYFQDKDNNLYHLHSRSSIWEDEYITAAIFSIIAIIVICGLILILRWFSRGRSKYKMINDKYDKFLPNVDILQPSQDCTMNVIERSSTPPQEALSSVPIRIEDFKNYVIEAVGDNPYYNELTEQYKECLTPITKPCTIGSLSQNANKNRYTNTLAYDDTRVILKDNYDRDYINANFIHGYDSPNAFIATQAPMKSTLGDFWWMIWQENVTDIIMLTRLQENDKIKSERYWPDLRQKVRYGRILIEFVEKSTFSDYVQRQLIVTCDKQQRQICHLQYINWPDHDVPENLENFAAFMEKVEAIPQNGAPIVVHCNAGCGRTGTVILCDIVLRMAAKEKKLDFVKVLTALRQQRCRLVNENQYVFAHKLVDYCLSNLNKFTN